MEKTMLNLDNQSKSSRIRELNDQFRSTFIGGAVLITAAFESLPIALRSKVLRRVREYDQFDSDNDPYLEHDMAFFEEAGEKFFFKIDYYAPNMRCGSDDPADPNKTRRVLTIGLASDY